MTTLETKKYSAAETGIKEVVWFPDPSCMGGARKGRKGLVNNSTPTADPRLHSCRQC